MKLIILIIFVCLVGCNNYYAFDFNSTSDSSCSFECETLRIEYTCFEAKTSYTSNFMNDNQLYGVCSCYIRSCIKQNEKINISRK